MKTTKHDDPGDTDMCMGNAMRRPCKGSAEGICVGAMPCVARGNEKSDKGEDK